MKFQNKVRTQLAIAGLGAVLLFAGAARAQEIENTQFSDGPNVMAFAQPVATQDAVTTNASPVLPNSQAVRAMAAISASTPVEQASVDSESASDTWVVGTLLAATSAIALYALALAKRVTRELHSRTNSYISNPGA